VTPGDERPSGHGDVPGPELAAHAAGELVEIVDEAGAVLQIVPRAQMRAERLRHRCTYIVVIDSQEQLVVHRRADWKDVWPGRWDLAFGGVVGVGEDWDEAAARELQEEAGVDGVLVAIGGGTFDDGDVSVLGRVYVTRSDGPFTVPDGEVAELARVPLAELSGWIDAHELCPDSLALAAGALQALASGPEEPQP
jgi:8-oxo-dGTP pyrophosphatase MutT (NUDIX family)